MDLLARWHELLARIGVKPAVGDPVLVAVIGLIASVVLGNGFDPTELRLAVVTALYALIGAAAPPAAHVRQTEVDNLAKKRSPR